jgi:hypothetical protein
MNYLPKICQLKTSRFHFPKYKAVKHVMYIWSDYVAWKLLLNIFRLIPDAVELGWWPNRYTKRYNPRVLMSVVNVLLWMMLILSASSMYICLCVLCGWMLLCDTKLCMVPRTAFCKSAAPWPNYLLVLLGTDL